MLHVRASEMFFRLLLFLTIYTKASAGPILNMFMLIRSDLYLQAGEEKKDDAKSKKKKKKGKEASPQDGTPSTETTESAAKVKYILIFT